MCTEELIMNRLMYEVESMIVTSEGIGEIEISPGLCSFYGSENGKTGICLEWKDSPDVSMLVKEIETNTMQIRDMIIEKFNEFDEDTYYDYKG